MNRCLALMFPLALTLAGCSALKGAEAPITMRLAPAAPVWSGTAGRSIVLDPIAARGVTSDRRYTYVMASDPRILRQASTLFWEESPPSVVARSIRQALSVRGSPVTSRDAAHLSVTLERFEEVSNPPSADAVVSLSAMLIDSGGARSLGTICQRVGIGSANPGDRAAAFESAVEAAAAALAERAQGRPSKPGNC